MNKISISLTLGTALTLSSCITPYQTTFDCPIPNGVPCTSMTKINGMIDKGLLGKSEPDEDCHCTERKINNPAASSGVFMGEIGKTISPQAAGNSPLERFKEKEIKEEPLLITYFEPEVIEPILPEVPEDPKAEELISADMLPIFAVQPPEEELSFCSVVEEDCKNETEESLGDN